jgi:hypothetical protein
MEKRFFLALALSFLVLFSYSALIKKTKPIDDKRVIDNSIVFNTEEPKKTLDAPLVSSTPLVSDNTLYFKDLYEFENGDLVFMFSQRGGFIKSIFDKTLEVDLDLVNIGLVPQWADYDFVLNPLPKGVEFIFKTPQGMIIKKSFRLKDDGTIDLNISLNDITTLDSIDYDIFAAQISVTGQPDQMSRRYFEGFYQIKNVVSRKSVLGLKSPIEILGKIEWAGLRDKYFCVVFSPQLDVNNGLISIQGQNPYLLFSIENSQENKMLNL